MKFSKKTQPSVAAGYPETNDVRASRLRGPGRRFLRDGDIVLVNGTNSFKFDPSAYAHITVGALDEGDGVYALQGAASMDANAQKVPLARFGTELAAKNGHAAVMRAFAGVSARKGGGGAMNMVKWTGGGVAALVLAVVVGSVVTPRSNAASAGQMAAVAQMQELQQMQAPQQAAAQVANAQANPQAFNPTEPTLEDLASGKYQFTPKIHAPQVEVPTLNCAKH